MVAKVWEIIPNDNKKKMTLKLSKTILENESQLSLQAMFRLLFVRRLHQHILTHSNDLFLRKLGSCFFLARCVEGICGGVKF